MRLGKIEDGLGRHFPVRAAKFTVNLDGSISNRQKGILIEKTSNVTTATFITRGGHFRDDFNNIYVRDIEGGGIYRIRVVNGTSSEATTYYLNEAIESLPIGTRFRMFFDYSSIFGRGYLYNSSNNFFLDEGFSENPFLYSSSPNGNAPTYHGNIRYLFNYLNTAGFLFEQAGSHINLTGSFNDIHPLSRGINMLSVQPLGIAKYGTMSWANYTKYLDMSFRSNTANILSEEELKQMMTDMMATLPRNLKSFVFLGTGFPIILDGQFKIDFKSKVDGEYALRAPAATVNGPSTVVSSTGGHQFTVDITTPNYINVKREWSVTAGRGTIDPDTGVYTASAVTTNTNVTITCTLDDSSTVTKTVVITPETQAKA